MRPVSRRHLFGLALGAGAAAALPARAFATGGFVPAGAPYTIGERAPELFVPADGKVVVTIRLDVSEFSAAIDDLIARLQRLQPGDPAGQAAVDRLYEGDVALTEQCDGVTFVTPGPAVVAAVEILRGST